MLWFKLSVGLSVCEHKSSNSFQWMILKPSRIVTHGTKLCVKAGFFYLSFPIRVMPLFQIFAYEYSCFFLLRDFISLGRIILW